MINGVTAGENNTGVRGDIDLLLGNFQFGKPKPGVKLTPGLQLRFLRNSIR